MGIGIIVVVEHDVVRLHASADRAVGGGGGEARGGAPGRRGGATGTGREPRETREGGPRRRATHRARAEDEGPRRAYDEFEWRDRHSDRAGS